MASSSSSLLVAVVCCCCCMLLAAAGTASSERKEIIDAAVAQVKREFSALKAHKHSKAQQRLRAFKVSTSQTRAQGLASLKFERMITVAERQILKKQRQAKVQTTESLAETLAMEFLHKPGSILTSDEVKTMFEESDCFETITTATGCNEPAAQKHRLPDGTCNNLENPTWGAAATRMRRLQLARYDDGWTRPRGFLQSQGILSTGVFSPPYPSPRISSIGIIADREDQDQDHTHILMQWGQFMDHDLDAIPEFEVDCPEDCKISSELEGMCYPFQVPSDDFNVMVTRTDPGSTGCHGFRRSLPACPEFGKVQPREQVNAITHFIDGSMVYHHDPEVQRTMIRDTTNDRGMLRTGDPSPADNSRPLLPDLEPGSHVALCPNPDPPCFVAGDFRVNEQSSLTVMHTLWVREHNRVAEVLRRGNPSLSGDKLFKVAQDIVISEIQKITYQDYLPIVLGQDFYDNHLVPYNGYDNTVEPTVSNAFATAAYRFGHSQIQPEFSRLGPGYQSIAEGPLSLVDAFFDTSHVRTLGIDSILRGLLTKNARQVDEFLNSVLTNQLFAEGPDAPGLDLAALNIQRGRDHGLPPYMVWKQWAKRYCGVESDFRNQLTQIRLLQTYGSLDNVDLFVGGLAEQPLSGGLVGAVFACIFADTFSAVRDGDRFYYENDDPDTSLFNQAQRDQFASASLSRVICDNTGINQIQPNAFRAGEPRVPCSSIPAMDLSIFNLAPSSSPLQQLPNVCYIRVLSNSVRPSQRYIAASRRSVTANFFAAAGSVPNGGRACYAILCPEGSSGSSYLRFIANNGRCSHQRNANLGPSLSSFNNLYFRRLVASDISPANGLYSSAQSCIDGSVDALTYTCSGQSAAEQHASTGDNEGTEVSQDELSNLVHNDDIMNEILSSDGGASNSSATSSSASSQLEDLLSTLLNRLQSKTSTNEKVAEAMAKKVTVHKASSDDMLVANLEKILERA